MQNSNLTSDIPFRFGKNESGEYGYIVTDSEGADSVIPFKKGGYIGSLPATLSGATSAGWRTTATVNISSVYQNYKNITIDNIVVQIPRCATIKEGSRTMVYSYDNTTGTITITGSGGDSYWMRDVSSMTIKVAIIE